MSVYHNYNKELANKMPFYGKIIGCFIFILILLIFFTSTSLYALSALAGTTAMDFVKLGSSVKSDSVGDAITATNELNALHVNPACIANYERVEMSLQYLFYFEDMNYKGLRAVLPSDLGQWGLNIGYMDMGSTLRTTWVDRSGTGDYFSNNAYQIQLAYAVPLNKYFNIGISVRQMSQKLDNSQADAIGLDIGTQYKMTDKIRFGIAYNGYTLKKAKYDRDEAGLAEALRVGVAYVETFFNNPLRTTLDLVSPSDDAFYYGLGFEYSINKILYMRAGYSTNPDIAKMSIGIGLFLDNTQIDFAYKPSILFGQSYRLGIGYMF